jgi:hypothetical protein
LDLSTLRFGQPVWLPLLGVPALLLLLWLWRLVERQRDRHTFMKRGSQPPLFGDLLSAFFLVLALAAAILALARPLVVVSLVRNAGIDLVVLQDASASMRVRDVQGDRWRRSMRFLRVLGQSLRWEDDRVALALFASIATPQIRLTRDPNTFFFFLDNLEGEPPFRLQDAGTWDTNIERGIYWGLRLVDKDRELLGPSNNARAFVLISGVERPGRTIARPGAGAENTRVRDRGWDHGGRRDPRTAARVDRCTCCVASRSNLARGCRHRRGRALLRARSRQRCRYRQHNHRGNPQSVHGGDDV